MARRSADGRPYLLDVSLPIFRHMAWLGASKSFAAARSAIAAPFPPCRLSAPVLAHALAADP
jgi:hypothetical protein